MMTTNPATQSTSSATPTWQRVLLASALIYPFWLLMVGNFAPAELLVGLAVAFFTAWLSKQHLYILDALKWQPAMPLHLVVYLGVFLWALIRANIDVARRVLSPHLPINPAIVTVETQLQSDLGKLLLANSITLTPGTLTVDVVGNHLQVHWIDSSSGQDMRHATALIAARFEYYLSKLAK